MWPMVIGGAGVYPPGYQAATSQTYAFAKDPAAGDDTDILEIVITGSQVRERHRTGQHVHHDAPVTPDPGDDIALWFVARYGELLRGGYHMVAQQTDLPESGEPGEWRSVRRNVDGRTVIVTAPGPV